VVRAAARPSERRWWTALWPWRHVRLPHAAVLLEIAAIVLALATFLALGRLYAAAPIVAVDDAGRTGIPRRGRLKRLSGRGGAVSTPSKRVVRPYVTERGRDWVKVGGSGRLTAVWSGSLAK
jgi:hypothetical protein